MQFLRNLVLGVAFLAAAAMPALAQSSKASDVYKVAIHVNDNDPARMNLALNNVQNMLSAYKKQGKKVDIRVVTYGPGLHMLRDDTSPVKARVQEMALANPNVTFNACGNTHEKMSKAAKKEVKLLSEAKVVPSGVLELVELQRKGFAYVKP